MKFTLTSLILIFSLTTAFAAQDYNSSRSNKARGISADLGDETEEFEELIKLAQTREYTTGDRKILSSVQSMEEKVEYLKTSMTINVFANHLLVELQKQNGCRNMGCSHLMVCSPHKDKHKRA